MNRGWEFSTTLKFLSFFLGSNYFLPKFAATFFIAYRLSKFQKAVIIDYGKIYWKVHFIRTRLQTISSQFADQVNLMRDRKDNICFFTRITSYTPPIT